MGLQKKIEDYYIKIKEQKKDGVQISRRNAGNNKLL